MNDNKAKLLIGRVANSLTKEEFDERLKLEDKQSKEWRNYWISVGKRHGLTNVYLAEIFGVSETTVRRVLKDKQ